MKEPRLRITLQIPLRWGIPLNKMRKAGRHPDLKTLVYSILAEIVEDELDEAKPSSAQFPSVSVAFK